MFIDVVPNGRSAPAVLLRESYREGKRVRKRTLANLGQLPPAMIDGLRVLLRCSRSSEHCRTVMSPRCSA